MRVWKLLVGAAVVLVCTPASASGAIVAAAGDIACSPQRQSSAGGGVGPASDMRCRQRDTARLLYGGGYDAVLPLGDLVYEPPSLWAYRRAWAPTWGLLKGKTYPAIGNHEYDNPGGPEGYWNYFNGVGRLDGRAGRRGRGWHTFALDGWRLIALNSNCAQVGCRGNSRQLKWLRRTLRRSGARCTLAYWHHPLFSSGRHGRTREVRPFWRALYRAGADVVLNGHDHVYERFAPQAPNGAVDHRRGMVQWTVGTGGRSLFPFTHRERNSRKRIEKTFGILRLGLAPGGYSWRFIDIEGNTLDRGTRRCR